MPAAGAVESIEEVGGRGDPAGLQPSRYVENAGSEEGGVRACSRAGTRGKVRRWGATGH